MTLTSLITFRNKLQNQKLRAKLYNLTDAIPGIQEEIERVDRMIAKRKAEGETSNIRFV